MLCTSIHAYRSLKLGIVKAGDDAILSKSVNILWAWTAYREDIGYLQGMPQLAGLLFCSLVTTDVLFGFYSMDMEEIQKFEIFF